MRKINLQDIFKRKTKAGDLGNSLAWPIHFVRDWKIVVLVFALGLAFLTVFAWRIYLSNQIGGGYLAPIVETSDVLVETIDGKRLQADLLILETKQTDFLKLKASQSKVIDPSL